MIGQRAGALALAAGVWRKVRTAFTLSPRAAGVAAAALLGVWLILVLTNIFETGARGLTSARMLGALGSTFLLTLISLCVLCVVWALGTLRLRLRVALLLLFPMLLLSFVGVWGVWGGLGAAVVLTLCITVLFGAGAALTRRAAPRSGRIVAIFAFGAGLVGACVMCVALFAPAPDPNPQLTGYHLRGDTLPLLNPSRRGPYLVTRFTYGGGEDRYRSEYGRGARFRTHSVDLSKLDLKWKGLQGFARTLYWGFDPSRFPLQGRVFMPGGPGAHGPFPLILVVHGNHDMEISSDPGYDYLGDLLASQGFIMVSVDENFLNSSLADAINPFSTRHGEENNARGVILLEHLQQWRAWTTDKSHPLYGVADLDRVGLVGHSRGGEAVAVAKTFNSLSHYPDDATLPFHYGFGIRAVAAIAPIDGQYKPRDHSLALKDVDYFVIHGSMDGDVTSFMGSAQYARAGFTGAQKAFKASLYVKDANHGQFNTVWGRYDDGLPTGLLLDTRPILDPKRQRAVLSVYLSAFMHAALKGEDAYRPLFEDARRGAGWLPDLYLVNNYADSDTRYFATYEEDLDPGTATLPGTSITGDNLTVWRERYAKLKDHALDTHVAVIGWDARAQRPTASYGFDFGPRAPQVLASDALVFSAADTGDDSLPKAERPKGLKPKKSQGAPQALDWTVAATDQNGEVARVPLTLDSPLYPEVIGQPRRLSFLSNEPTSEIVLRRFRLPLSAFKSANPRIDLNRLKRLGFVFDRSARGVIALDDVGFAPTP